jgi:hypothetical protein
MLLDIRVYVTRKSIETVVPKNNFLMDVSTA